MPQSPLLFTLGIALAASGFTLLHWIRRAEDAWWRSLQRDITTSWASYITRSR